MMDMTHLHALLSLDPFALQSKRLEALLSSFLLTDQPQSKQQLLEQQQENCYDND